MEVMFYFSLILFLGPGLISYHPVNSIELNNNESEQFERDKRARSSLGLPNDQASSDNIPNRSKVTSNHHYHQQYFRVRPQTNVEVIEGASIILHCSVGNQAGPVQWAKDGFVLGFDRTIPGYPRYSMIGNASEGVHNLKIEKAQIDDDGEYQCQVGPATNNKAIRANSRLTVLLRPKKIEIVGHSNGSAVEVRQGERVSLQCIVYGGKPGAKIKWFRKDIELTTDNIPNQSVSTMTTTMADGSEVTATKSEISLSLHSEDNGVTFSCQAIHPALTTPLRSTISISVLYPPGQPEISGYSEGETVRMGDTLTLRCRSRGGNPLARLVWYKNSEQIDYSYDSYGGRESVNELQFIVDSSHNNVKFTCEAASPILPKPMSTSVTLSVQFAPAKVTILGPSEAKAGDNVTMVCTTDASNPASEVNWVVDGRSISTQNINKSHSKGGYITIANITLPISTTDRNMKMFSCFAVNRALGETVFASHTLSILYPPFKPSIIGFDEGVPLRAGSLKRLTCESQGGNPLADLKWFKGKDEITSGWTSSSTSNGVSSELAIVVKDSDNGALYRCEASNSATVKPLEASVKLNVHYKPEFSSESPVEFELVEGSTGTINLTSKGNPSNIKYKWFKIGDDLDPNRFITDGPILNITSVSRSDSGSYRIEATNSQGTTKLPFKINVKYAASITKTSDLVYAEVGKTAYLECTVDANPITKDLIKWQRRPSYLESDSLSPDSDDIETENQIESDRFKPTLEDNRSFLIVFNVTENDSGAYECLAYNGIGQQDSAFANLVVKHEPRIINSPVLSKSASESGSTGRLVCRAQGAPNITFEWIREGSTISETKSDSKYSVEPTESLDLITYQSVLNINNVDNSDYGLYKCIARNELGTSRLSVHFNRTSKPDRPLALKIVNRTSSSISLKWIPGFDGGLSQSFRIRYQKSETESPYQYSDVYPANTTQYTIKGLDDNSEYSFAVMSYNELGESKYTDDIVKGKTLQESPISETERVISQVFSGRSGDIPRLIIIAVSVLGSLLLMLNVALVVCFVRKRRKKRLEEETDGSSTAKAATIEMYAPASGSGGSYTNGPNETSLSGSDEEKRSEAAYSGQTDYAMEITPSDAINGNQQSIHPNIHSNMHGSIHQSLSTYLIDDSMGHVNSYYQPPGFNNYVNPVGPDVTVNTYFIDDPQYIDALRKNSYNQHLETNSSGLIVQTQINDKSPTEENNKSINIPPVPPLRSTNLSSFLPMINEEPMFINNAPLGHLV